MPRAAAEELWRMRNALGDAALKLSAFHLRHSQFWKRVAVWCFTGKPFSEIIADEEYRSMMSDRPFGCPPDVPNWGARK